MEETISKENICECENPKITVTDNNNKKYYSCALCNKPARDKSSLICENCNEEYFLDLSIISLRQDICWSCLQKALYGLKITIDEERKKRFNTIFKGGE